MILIEAVTKLSSLVGATNALKEKLDAAIEFADKAQQQSLALGLTYEDTRKTLGGQLEGLRGSLDQRFKAGIETLNAGMTGNTMGVSRLINQQMLTNTAFKATADTFAKLEVALGLTNEETNSLALSLLKYGNQYQIGTDKLVQALNALADTMPVQKLVGLGQNFQEAILQLQGIVGPQLSQELTGFVKTVLDPSFENLSRLAGLGILEQREQLLANRNNTDKLLDLLQNMIKTSAERVRMFGQGAQSEFAIASVPMTLFGEKMLNALSLADGLGKRVLDINDYIAEYYLTIQTLKKEIFVPIENALSTLHKPLVTLYEVLSFVAKAIGSGVGKWLEETLAIGSETLKNIKIGLLQFSKTVIEIFYPIVTFIGENATELIRSVFTGITDFFINLTEPGGIMAQVEAAFYGLYAAILHVSDFFGADIADVDIEVYEKKAVLKEIEIAIAEGARSIKDLSETQQEAIQDFNLGGKVSEAFKEYALASNKSEGLKNLSKALGGIGGEKPEIIQKLEQGIEYARKGLPLDESMVGLLGQINANTKKDVEIRTPDFLQESMDTLSLSLERILGAGTVDSANGIIEAIENLDGTVQRGQLKNRALGSSFRGQQLGF
jgi:hypothetical protein